MNNSRKILSVLILLYIMVLPIFPGKYNFKNVPFNGDVILALIMLIYLLSIIIHKDSRERFIKGFKDFFTNPLSLFIFAIICVMSISVIYATDKKIAISETIRFATYAVLFFIIKYELNEKKIIDNILKIYFLTTGIIGVIGIAEYFLGIGFIQKSESGVRNRIFSTMENSNNLGMFMILIIFPLIMLFLNEKERKHKYIYGALSLIAFINIILSYSRNAWLGFGIGLIVLTLIYSWKIILGILGIGIISIFIPSIFNRLKEFTDISQNMSRIKLWDIALLMIKDHPVKGVGNGNYRVLYDTYKLKLNKKIEYYPSENFHPHNIFLKIQSEIGVFGLIFFLGMMISVFKNIINFIKKYNGYYGNFYKGFLASFVAFLSMNFIDNFFSAPKVIAFFWILIAILEGIKYREKVGGLY
ncbi:O-antigen ligase family protein [Clostridium cochlearium]|uniref:O-antigen ligase family protein n=2 Tax=Clostridium cochlearium TaxID=1494 RepID=A0A240ASH3_CLOCO|nr:O-antigen ligase family protein [Clostridium cochlearium]MBU5268300.1 O-antigen ligase family protein [Clostridium cochlearium]MCR1970853.1 O-antigen ligase family protein [Clostridium cochlearium]NOH16292.1 O-antigen ligase family protein [Clostridium cochlearium]SNV86330.1 exopolysaccharide biosynthesis family protein [Clostridium cochlearium]STA93369.1 exopolysaccharide biosynthesis family protein [Clostridium cochlearium]